MSPTAHKRHASRGDSGDWHHLPLQIPQCSPPPQCVCSNRSDTSPRGKRRDADSGVLVERSPIQRPVSPIDRPSELQSPTTRQNGAVSTYSQQQQHRNIRWKSALGVAALFLFAAGAWLHVAVVAVPLEGYIAFLGGGDSSYAFPLTLLTEDAPVSDGRSHTALLDYEESAGRSANHLDDLPRGHIRGSRSRFPPRVVFALGEPFGAVPDRTVQLYPAAYSDITQTYPTADSRDLPASETMEMRTFPRHEFDEDCVPMAGWQTTFHPTCNGFHERDISDDLRETLSLISDKGSWRSAWELRDWAQSGWRLNEGSEGDASVVLKLLQYAHNMEDAFYEFSRVDAISMEQLTASPYVMDIFGFCGMSVVTSYAGEEITQHADTLEPMDKLYLGKMVAEGLADIHGIGGGGTNVSLIHNDINFSNLLISRRRQVPEYNDFNIGVLQMWNERTKEPCRFVSHFPNPQWRSPEEQVDGKGVSNKRLTEKIDIYALGNVFFRFIVGKGPWKITPWRQDGKITREDKDRIASLKLEKGATPPLPSEVKTLRGEDPAIGALFRAMKMCYKFDPVERPSARQLVDFLDDAIASIEGAPR